MNTYHLWEGEVPGKMLEEPVLTHYSPKNKTTKACVLILPGGGYHGRAKHEGEGYAEFLNAFGMEAFVLSYRVTRGQMTEGVPLFPYPLLDARRAVRYLRKHADTLGIDPDKIAVMGSSAGGHLAALLSTYRGPIDGEGVDALDDGDCIPNAQILCYPVITADETFSHKGSYTKLLGYRYEERAAFSPDLIADEKTPVAFLWHTAEDGAVNVTNSYLYATKLRALKIPCEMHIFPFGGHGRGVAADDPHIHQWVGLLENWFRLMEWLPKE